MADSIRERILAALYTALNTAAPCTVVRGRVDPVALAELPLLVLSPLREAAIREQTEDEPDADAASASEPLKRTLTVAVVALVGANPAAGASLDQQADPLLAHAVSALQADPTLGGLSTAIREASTEWLLESRLDKDVDYLVAEIRLEIDYYTRRGDLTVAA